MKISLYVHSVKGNFLRCLFISSYEGKPIKTDDSYIKLMKLCDEAKEKFCHTDDRQTNQLTDNKEDLLNDNKAKDKAKLFELDVTATVIHKNLSIPINDNAVYIKVPVGLSYTVDKFCGKYATISLTHYVYNKKDGEKGITFYLTSIKEIPHR